MHEVLSFLKESFGRIVFLKQRRVIFRQTCNGPFPGGYVRFPGNLGMRDSKELASDELDLLPRRVADDAGEPAAPAQLGMLGGGRVVRGAEHLRELQVPMEELVEI